MRLTISARACTRQGSVRKMGFGSEELNVPLASEFGVIAGSACTARVTARLPKLGRYG